MNLAIIKSSDFDTNGVTGTAYTLGHRARVFSLSSLSFDAADYTVTDDVLTLNVPVVARKREYIADGVTKVGLDLIPEDCGITIVSA